MYDFSKNYNREEFLEFLKNFLPNDLFLKEEEYKDESKITLYKKILQLGEIPSLDNLSILEVEHDSINDPRVSLTKKIFTIFNKLSINKAIVVFYCKDSDNYRFSLIESNYKWQSDTVVSREFSLPTRLSFFLGPEAKIHTPSNQLKKKIISYNDLKSRFDIEVISDEFFNQYKKLYINLLDHLNKVKKTETLEGGEIAYICEIEIEAKAEPIKQIKDPNFNFSVKLNEYNFKTGDNLIMEITFTKPMYLTIFQFLPYEKEGNQVSKLFPNEREENNFIKSKKITLPHNAKYEVYFPDNVNKKNIDEYLFFITSDENIDWLDEYNNIYELKSSYINSTKRVKTKYKQYTIYK